MKNFRLKIYMAMLIIGFIFISLDVNIDTGKSYPKQYDNSKSVIGEFQYYNIASNYGGRCTYKLLNDDGSTYDGAKVIDKVYYGNIRVDILSDFVGFLLIFIACINLGITGKRFKLAALSSVCAFLLKGMLFALPFVFNGLLLCNIVLVIGLAYLGCTVLTTFLFTSGLLNMCPDICCRDERKWVKMCWFGSFVLQVLVTFIFWLGSDFKMLMNLGWTFNVILILVIILYWTILRRTSHYLEDTFDKASK